MSADPQSRPTPPRPGLSGVVALLACPVCHSSLDLDARTLVCERGHAFDVARQGYVTLARGALSFSGDDAAMLDDRDRFLGAGHYRPVLDAVRAACALGADDRRILEIGAGTGYYLAGVLDTDRTARGLAMDVSKAAARRAARAHPAVGSVVADAWSPWPVADRSLTHVLCVFAPRNAEEIDRVLSDDGVLVVVTPGPRHLAEVLSLPGMVRVDDRKAERLEAALSGRFRRIDSRAVEFGLALDHAALDALVGMGPTAHHLSPAERSAVLADLPPTVDVTASVTVSVWARGVADGERRVSG